MIEQTGIHEKRENKHLLEVPRKVPHLSLFSFHFNNCNNIERWRVEEKEIHHHSLTLSGWGSGEGQRDPPTSFSSVTYANAGITPKTF